MWVIYQLMVGFGVVVMDVLAWLLQNCMSLVQCDVLLKELFGLLFGLVMNMMWLIIGVLDFLFQFYILDDMFVGEIDLMLQYFNVIVNLYDVIFVVCEVLVINFMLWIIGLLWSVLVWMKISDNLIGGELFELFEGVYVDYLVKYVDVYCSYGILIFVLIVQNELGYLLVIYLGMIMFVDMWVWLIGDYFGLVLVICWCFMCILVWDYNWDVLDQLLDVLVDLQVECYVGGVVWYCYVGIFLVQSQVYCVYLSKDVYIIECLGGDWELVRKGELMWFVCDLLLVGICYWVCGVVYWNFVFDEQYGLYFGGCDLCKGVVIIDVQIGVVMCNDEYYVFVYFSCFVLLGVICVGLSEIDKDVNNVVFVNFGDGLVVLVVVNSCDQFSLVLVWQGQVGFVYIMLVQSVVIFVWNFDLFGFWLWCVLCWLDECCVVLLYG